jgi:hypothetical protein
MTDQDKRDYDALELTERVTEAVLLLQSGGWSEHAEAISTLLKERDALREALERIARYDVGLQGLREDGKDTPDNVANYYAAQIERRRKIARAALSTTRAMK